MDDPRTLGEAMQRVNASFKDLQRAMADQLVPSLTRLTEALEKLLRDWYLLRVRRLVPWFIAALLMGALVGWWIT